MFQRQDTFYLLGSPLVGYGVADNFYLTAPSPLGPWTVRGTFAPPGSETFHSQTFQGLSIAGSKGTSHVFIGHRWNAVAPPFPNATSIWLPLEFNRDGSLAEMKYVDSWVLDPDGAIDPSGSQASGLGSSGAAGGALDRARAIEATPSGGFVPVRWDYTATLPLEYQGKPRIYHVQFPSEFAQAQRPCPAIMFLHGASSNASVFEAVQSLSGAALRSGYVLIFPEGAQTTATALPTGERNWNAGTCCGEAVIHGSDDVAFLRAVVKHATATFVGIDRDRVRCRRDLWAPLQLGIFPALPSACGADPSRRCTWIG